MTAIIEKQREAGILEILDESSSSLATALENRGLFFVA